jgi:hypothetical protein
VREQDLAALEASMVFWHSTRVQGDSTAR